MISRSPQPGFGGHEGAAKVRLAAGASESKVLKETMAENVGIPLVGSLEVNGNRSRFEKWLTTYHEGHCRG